MLQNESVGGWLELVKTNSVNTMQMLAEKLLNPNNYHLSPDAKKHLRWLYILYYDQRGNISAAARKAGIQKRTTMHTLRHTFATHSLENGVDLRYIQSMMGHESSKTTEIYTHITTKGFDQIKSPLDNLDL